MKRWQLTLFIGMGMLLAACATDPDISESHLERLASSSLSHFAGEDDFRRYIRVLQREARRRGEYWAGLPGGGYDLEDGEIIVTAQRRESIDTSPSTDPVATFDTITNVQERGVDEGDVVKRVGRFLVILNSGRLFSIDLGERRGELRIADRANVYRNEDDQGWIDEVLVYGQNVVVTGYSYERSATEIALFTIGNDGRFSRGSTYYLSSNDYYDAQNYATRLVDGNLVVYTPLDLSTVDPKNPVVWPRIRRWLRDEDGVAKLSDGIAMFDTRSIYRPLQALPYPTLHMVTVCPLRELEADHDLHCHSTGFVGGGERQVYVTPNDVYVWNWREERRNKPDCDEDPAVRWRGGQASVLQIPISGAVPRALRVEGYPQDQFSLDVSNGEFRALLIGECDELDDPYAPSLAYFHAPLSAFDSVMLPDAGSDAYDAAPSAGDDRIVARFTDTYLVYGARSSWGLSPPTRYDEPFRPGRLVAVPTSGGAPTILDAPHQINRIEAVGEAMFLTGYRDNAGLYVSRMSLGAAPQLSGTVSLGGRFEAESRSHAFGARIQSGGDGVVALPTAAQGDGEDGYYPWESSDNDISYISFDRHGYLHPLGILRRGREVRADEACEVSCIDWYGNARPVFIGTRVFALTGADLVEGVIRQGRIREVQRLRVEP